MNSLCVCAATILIVVVSLMVCFSLARAWCPTPTPLYSASRAQTTSDNINKCCTTRSCPRLTDLAISRDVSTDRFDVDRAEASFRSAGVSSIGDLCKSFSMPKMPGSYWDWCVCTDVTPSGGYNRNIQLESYWKALKDLENAGLLKQRFGKTPHEQLVFVASHLCVIGTESYAFQNCHEVAGTNDCNWHIPWGDGNGPLGEDCDQSRRDCGRGQGGYDYNPPQDCGCATDAKLKSDQTSPLICGACATKGCTYGVMECNTTSSNKGACWWARGASSLTGPCNYKLVSDYLATHALNKGVDLCANPNALCEDPELYFLSSFAYFLMWLDRASDEDRRSFDESLVRATDAMYDNSLFDLAGSYWGCSTRDDLTGSDIPFVWGLYGINALNSWTCYGDSLHPGRSGYGCSSGWLVTVLHILLSSSPGE